MKQASRVSAIRNNACHVWSPSFVVEADSLQYCIPFTNLNQLEITGDKRSSLELRWLMLGKLMEENKNL